MSSETTAVGLAQKVVAASAGRDRVIDTAKTAALMLVVVGHSLAWTIQPDGTVTNTLEAAPQLYPLTWVLQILPVFFFLAGNGMVRYAEKPTSAGLLQRSGRLVTPTAPLFLVTIALTSALAAFVPGPTAVAAGILPVQLTWFVGVYLLVLSVSPLLRRARRLTGLALLMAAIVATDVVRATLAPPVGWLNMLLVWSFFAALGMSLPRWRKLHPAPLLALAGLFVSLAVLAVWLGPYSKALVTTAALPGLSNLAPPTVVLALAGMAQICLLLAAWGPLERALRSNRLWVPVAVFSSRAMGVYLWHMLILSLLVAVVAAIGFRAPALSLTWWAVHVAVLVVLALTVWLIAPPALRAADFLGRALSVAVPKSLVRRSLRLTVWVAAPAWFLVGTGYLLSSESGVSDPLTFRLVLGVPYVPMALVAVLAFTAALAARTSTQAAES